MRRPRRVPGPARRARRPAPRSAAAATSGCLACSACPPWGISTSMDRERRKWNRCASLRPEMVSSRPASTVTGTGKERWRRAICRSSSEDCLNPFGLSFYAQQCGWTLARAHTRSGDPIAISALLGKSDKSDQAMTDSSERCADQNERDHKESITAIKSGACRRSRASGPDRDSLDPVVTWWLHRHTVSEPSTQASEGTEVAVTAQASKSTGSGGSPAGWTPSARAAVTSRPSPNPYRRRSP